MKWLFHFILSHSIFIAICAAALSLQTVQLLLLPFNEYLQAFIFFATLLGYNAYWMVSSFSFNRHTSFLSFLQSTRSSLFVLVAAGAGIIVCVQKLHLVMFNIISTIILLGLYALPLLPYKQLHYIREAGFLKTIILALAWTIVTVLIPLQISIFEMDEARWLVFINRFLFMLMLCIIFDKRDAAIDKIRGLKSLATEIKPGLLHGLICMVCAGYLLVCFSMNAYAIKFQQVFALVITGGITLGVYFSSLKKRSYIFYYFLVDGLMLLSALLTAMAGIMGD